ncbi:MAG: DNA polymerase II large subunit [Methanosarcinales archaeon]|nr:MAG: DNA polymerase II large subunit [Methanosarcinales archaeon]
MNQGASDSIIAYFNSLEAGLERAMQVAKEARSMGADPETYPEIPPAKDLADRVENLVCIEGVAKRIRELESNSSREEAALHIGLDFAEGMFGMKPKIELIEGAIRTAVAILTEGVVAAPIEGIARVGLGKNDDGTSYLKIYYAGPIRSAGGTAQTLSVLVADYVRQKLGVDRYKPRREEVERYVEEISLYGRVANLQYMPSPDEIKLIVENCPICIDGEPTEVEEVSGYRNLERVETNRLRGGMALVIAEGVAQKAPKIKKYVSLLSIGGWEWLDRLVVDTKREDDVATLKPKKQFLEDIIAGRPVFSHPSARGGFRLRYGRARNSGFATAGISPATMVLLDDFIAPGTQLKIERPGKAAGAVPVDTIEGPTVRLINGDVLRVDSMEQARELRRSVVEVLDIGEILISYGDFLENAHPLVPASYCYEWWIQELEAKTTIQEDLRNITPERAIELSEKFGVPLHPKYTYLWHDISVQELEFLANYLSEKGEYDEVLTLPNDQEVKNLLETLLVQHKVQEDNIIIEHEHACPLIRCLGLNQDLSRLRTQQPLSMKTIDAVSALSGILVRERAPVRIGGRMGRPEKSKKREMRPPVHVLFPIGKAGGRRRFLQDAHNHTSQNDKKGVIEVELGVRKCTSCGKTSFEPRCDCGGRTQPTKFCPKCNIPTGDKELCPRCNTGTTSTKKQIIDFRSIYSQALSNLGERNDFGVKGVIGMISKDKTPEPLEKGILRAKHDVCVFKDGTVRYDLTDLPLAHFTPKEIGTPIEKLKTLGYSVDYNGSPLVDENQVVELKPQDVVLSKDGGDYLLRTTHFIDDLLTKYYGLEPYYQAQSRDDLIGQLVIGLAPHTSAGVLGRMLGFTNASVGYAHPFFHAAKRRNCFGPDTKIPILEKGIWKIATIKELVEKNLNNPKTDDFGTLYSEVKNIKTLAFNEKTKKFELAEISHVSKHAPQKTITLRTKSGREVTTTLGHPFPTKNGEKVALELEDVFTPHNIKVPRRDISEFLLSNFTENLMVKIPRDIFEGMNKKKIAEKYNLKYKTFTNYIYRRSYPLSIAKDFIKKQELEKYKISAKRDTVRLPLVIKCDEDFMFLLGIYLAEGHIRKGKTKGKANYQIGFAASDSVIKKLIAKKIEKVFGTKPYVGKETVTLCSRIIYYFFLNLGIGKNAREKGIPSFVFSLPKKKIRPLLAGLFLGDGSVSLSSTLEVNYSSVSKRMIDEISFLLLQFGIKHSFSVKDDGNKKHAILHKIRIYSKYAELFVEDVGFKGYKQENAEKLVSLWKKKKKSERTDRFGEVFIDKIVNKQIKPKEETVYSLTVPLHHTIIANGIVSHQCDGDEDCVMLLMDGLLNFSRSYLPERRGGKMDAPLVLTMRIDPSEIDSEAHNIDLVRRYPLEFYEATLHYTNPKEVGAKMDLMGARLSTPAQYEGFGYTHDTSDIAAGPAHSAYKTLGAMVEKMEAQLKLAKKVRAVDAKDVAERVITSHFLPDLIGNLRAFSRQKMRCVKCNAKFRRPPLKGTCPKCGGRIILTVHEGAVKKYLDVSLRIAEEYDVSNYTKQRLKLITLETRSLFEGDKSKQMGLVDFM